MRYLEPERATLARLLPGLDEAMAGHRLAEMERPGSPAITLFRDAAGPGLLVPVEHGGHGATGLDAVRVQRAVGARSPSLAVATTMHHFSVATLVEMAHAGMEWLVLEGIAVQRLLVASGFAEGRSDTGLFASGLEVRPVEGGVILRGSKRPCSLSASMDLLTASALLPGDDGPTLIVALLPATLPGISRRSFWQSPALAGAESDEVVFDDVMVPEEMLTRWGRPGQLDTVQIKSFVWFELLISGSYLGVASALVERTRLAGRGTAESRAALACETEGAMAALEGIARAMMSGEVGEDLLARAVLARFAVQDAVERAANRAAELLGGMAFVSEPDVALLLASARALAFHPPSRRAAATALDSYLAGGALRLE